MRTSTIEGIIIKRRNIGEANRILTVFTEHCGKLDIKAVGVRRITSRRSSHVELLNHSVLSIYRGKSLPVLIEAQAIETFQNVKQSLTKVGFAYHICELIDGLCAENQENIRIFDLLKETFHRLGCGKDITSAIHEFEIELLSVLGFWSNRHTAINLDTSYIIENILERKLKSRRFLSEL